MKPWRLGRCRSRNPAQPTRATCAGDTTGNVWWRVENGELPRNHAPKVVVLMIGANDLSGAYVNCGTWDEGDYTNAAASIAQQCAPLSQIPCARLMAIPPQRCVQLCTRF